MKSNLVCKVVHGVSEALSHRNATSTYIIHLNILLCFEVLLKTVEKTSQATFWSVIEDAKCNIKYVASSIR